MPPAAQGELVNRMQRFRMGTTRFKDVDDLGNGIKELRVRVGNNPYRILFCVIGSTPVALTVFYKNQVRTPKTDLDRAKARSKSHYSA